MSDNSSTDIAGLYQSVLGRAPDAEGAAYWSQQFGNTIGPEQVATFRNAAASELAGRNASAPPPSTVEGLYQSVLGRAPDAGGAAYWAQQFGNTIDPNEIAQFRNAAASELAAQNTTTSANPTSIDQLYQQVLGRAPDAGGAAYWAQQFGNTIEPNELAQFREAAAAELYGPNYNNPDKPYLDYFKSITPSGELTPGNFGRQTALDLAWSGKLDQDAYTKVLQNSSNRTEIESIIGLGKDILDKAPKKVDPNTLNFGEEQMPYANVDVGNGNGTYARYDRDGNLMDFTGTQVWPLVPDGQGGYKTALPRDTRVFAKWDANGKANLIPVAERDNSLAGFIRQQFGVIPDIALAIATSGSSLPVQLASKAALDLARGATPMQVLQGGISSYLSAGVADYTGLSDAIKGIDNKLLQDTLTSATRGGLSAALSGRNIVQGITVGAVSGAVSNIGNQYLTDTSLTAVQRNALMSSATAYAQSIASGQSGDVALKNAFMAGGKAAGTQFAKDLDREYGITESLNQTLGLNQSTAQANTNNYTAQIDPNQFDRVSIGEAEKRPNDLSATAFLDAKNLGANDEEAKRVADSVAGTTNTASGNVNSISEVVVAPDVQVAGNYMPEIPQPKAGQLMVDSTGRPISIGVISYDSSGKGQLVAAPIIGDQTSGYSYEVNGKPQNLTQEQYERLFAKTNPSEYLKMAEKMYASSGDLDAFNKAFGVKDSAAKPVTTIDVDAKEVPATKSSSSLLKNIISKVGGLDAVEIGGALAVPEVADIAKKAMDQGFAKDIFDQLSQYPSRDDKDTRYLNDLYKNMTGDYVPGTPLYNYAHRSELQPVEVYRQNVENVNADILDDAFVSGPSEGVPTNTNQDINQAVINAASSGANPANIAQEVSKTDPNINVETSVDPQTGATSVTTTNANNNTVTSTQTDGKTQTTTNVNNNTGITTNTSSGGSNGTITTTVTDTVSGGGAVITKDPITDKIVAVETTGKNVQVIDSNTVVIDDKKIDVSTGTVVSTPVTPTTTAKSTTAKTATPSTAKQPSSFGLLDAGQALGTMSFLGPQFLKTKENKKQFIDPLSLYRGAASAEGIPIQQISPQIPSDSLDKYYNYGKAESIDDILGLNKKDDESRNSSALQSAIDNLLNVPYAAKNGGLVPPLMAAGGSVRAQKYAQGGLSVPLMNHGGKLRGDFRHGAHVAGPGDGQSDDIPAMLADGEFVFPADVVSALGNGSTKAGSDKLYEMMHSIRDRARSKGSKDLPPPALKSPLDYLKSRKNHG